MVPVPPEAVWPDVIEKESMWCSPKQGSYKMRLREVYKDYSRFKSQANALKRWILKTFTPDAQYQKFNEALEYSSISLLELVKEMNNDKAAPKAAHEAAFYTEQKQAKLLNLIDKV